MGAGEAKKARLEASWGSSWREMLAGKQGKRAGWRTKKRKGQEDDQQGMETAKRERLRLL